MSAYTLGLRPFSSQPLNAFPTGEFVAATPLGRDADGKNLVAYIVRTDDAPPLPPLSQDTANGNDPKARLLQQQNAPNAAAQKVQQAQVKTAQDASAKDVAKNPVGARFIKPQALLSSLQQAEVQHLGARDQAVKQDASNFSDGEGNSLITSFVYNEGPDGKRYAIGVAAPLLAQKASRTYKQNTSSDGVASTKTPLNGGADNIHVRAAIAYRQTSYSDGQGSTGLVDISL